MNKNAQKECQKGWKERQYGYLTCENFVLYCRKPLAAKEDTGLTYTGYELLWFFFFYAFAGWVLEVVFATFTNKKLANRGFLNGPFCPVYGLGMCFLLVFFGGLLQNLFFLFVGSMVVTSLLELLTGRLLEKLYGRKWWDYSDYKYNYGGYVCLRFSLIWAAEAVVLMRWLNPFVAQLIRLIPPLVGRIVLAVLTVMLACDFLVTTKVVLMLKKRGRRIQEFTEGVNRFTGRMGGAIAGLIQRRMTKAFPHLREADGLPAKKAKEESGVFAKGCCFHKLVWLFFIGAFLGDITETIWCYVTMGKLMSRSSVVYGPFSVVWGIAVVLLTLLLDRYKDKPDRYIFIFGTVVGGAYEYICSVFTELVFGTVFWDYSHLPFNLGGRINLLFCFFWGIAALVWLKFVYPFLSRLIEKVPKKAGTWLSFCFVVFMILNMAISALALSRYSERAAGKQAENGFERFLDEHYTDERMERIYPNAKMTS